MSEVEAKWKQSFTQWIRFAGGVADRHFGDLLMAMNGRIWRH